jgi:hypothetical protein
MTKRPHPMKDEDYCIEKRIMHYWLGDVDVNITCTFIRRYLKM